MANQTKPFNQEIEDLETHIANKLANLDCIEQNLKHLKKVLKNANKCKRNIIKYKLKKTLTEKKATREAASLKTMIRDLNMNVNSQPPWKEKSSYRDPKFAQSKAYLGSENFRHNWRNKSRAIIESCGNKKILKKYNRPELRKPQHKQPCYSYNNLFCNRKACYMRHVCSECFYLLKERRRHVYGHKCPVYQIRKAHILNHKSSNLKLESDSDKDSSSDSDNSASSSDSDTTDSSDNE